MSEAVAPVVHEFVVPCSAAAAFETYPGRIGDWWDPRYTANAETFETVVIEPRVGGRVYARHTDIGGVEFLPGEDGGSTVRFAHGGWTQPNAAVRSKFAAWRVMLDRFAALAG